MKDGEILKADTGGKLVVNNTVQASRDNAQRNNADGLHVN